MSTDGAVANTNVQQGHKQERDAEHDVAKCDPPMKRKQLDCAHVERGGEGGCDEVGHGDGLCHLWEVMLVQEDEVVYGRDVTVPGEKKPDSGHQHTDVDHMKAILWLHIVSHLTKGIPSMEEGEGGKHTHGKTTNKKKTGSVHFTS